MKPGILCLCVLACIGLLLVAGCTSGTGRNGATGTAVSPAAGTSGQAAIDQDRVFSLSNGTYAFNVSIDEVSATALPPGGHQVNIFTTLVNTGKTPVQLRWFSTLTGADGRSFGGVGVSHGGYGAETDPDWPGISASGRDYVTIASDQEYQALKNGAVLRIDFFTVPLASRTGQIPASFSATWTLDPADFT